MKHTNYVISGTLDLGLLGDARQQHNSSKFMSPKHRIEPLALWVSATTYVVERLIAKEK